jgi:hypothetical protein
VLACLVNLLEVGGGVFGDVLGGQLLQQLTIADDGV